MRKSLLSLALILSGIVSAQAADLPVKTKAVTPLTIPACGSGIYLGLGTTGSAGAVANSPVPGASIVQGEVGATIGYTSTVGTCATNGPNAFWFIEGNFYWTNLNGTTNGLNLSGPADLFQRVGYSNPALTSILASLPGFGSISTPSLPILPAGVTAGAPAPYVYLGLHEQDVSAFFAGLASNREWEVSPEFGVGMWTRLSNSVVVDVYAGYELQAQGLCIGPTGFCPAIGNMWRAGVKFDF